VTIQGEPGPRFKNVFVMGSCAPVAGAAILSFKKEDEMLDAWSRFVRCAQLLLVRDVRVWSVWRW
jgi:DNA polymerase delta subunit 1